MKSVASRLLALVVVASMCVACFLVGNSQAKVEQVEYKPLRSQACVGRMDYRNLLEMFGADVGLTWTEDGCPVVVFPHAGTLLIQEPNGSWTLVPNFEQPNTIGMEYKRDELKTNRTYPEPKIGSLVHVQRSDWDTQIFCKVTNKIGDEFAAIEYEGDTILTFRWDETRGMGRETRHETGRMGATGG